MGSSGRVIGGWLIVGALAFGALPAAAEDLAPGTVTVTPRVAAVSDSMSCPGASTLPTAANIATIERAVTCLINGYRHAAGRKNLQASAPLRTAARRYGRRMVEESFFGHVGPGGLTLVKRLRAVHYITDETESWAAAENLATGGGELATARHIVGDWMASPEHRSNILRSKLRNIGVGMVQGSPDDVGPSPFTVVVDLGSRS